MTVSFVVALGVVELGAGAVADGVVEGAGVVV
jgi:hypothetical protein